MVTSAWKSATSQELVAEANARVEVGASVGGATVVTIGKVAVTVGSSGADRVSSAWIVMAAAVNARSSFVGLFGRLQAPATTARIKRLRMKENRALRMKESLSRLR